MHNYLSLFLWTSLALLPGCTVDKGGDSDAGDSTGTTSAGSQGTTSAADDTGTAPTTGAATGTGEGAAQCIETPTVLAADEPSALGFSAEQLLADKLGPRSTTLLVASEPTTLADAWKGKSMPLTVELKYAGGEVRLVDSAPNPDYDGGEEGSLFGECEDRLEVDVELDFITQAGELAEHRAGPLRATTVERGELQVDLLPPALMGTLDPASLYSDPAWHVTGLVVHGVWQGTKAGGELLNEVEVGGGPDGTVGFGSLVSWGDAIAPI